MNGGRLYLILGVGLAVLALVELFAPGTIPVLADDVVLIVLGFTALVYGYVVFRSRQYQPVEGTETPDVEVSEPTRVPGEDIASVLEQFPGTETVRQSSLPTVKTGLENAAVTVLTQYENCTEEEARERIAAGEWTEDEHATRFLAEGSSQARWRDRLRLLATGASVRRRAITHTIDAIVHKTGVKRDGDDAKTAPAVEQADTESADGDDPVDLPEETEAAVDAGFLSLNEGYAIGKRRSTHRLAGVGLVALLCLGVGILTRQPGVLLGSIVGIGYAAYARSLPMATPELSIERSLSETEPEAGADVEVTLTVTNEGQERITDLRIIDGVPAALSVSEGSPRMGTSLPAGGSVSLNYSITAKRGQYVFDPALLIVRNRSGAVEQEVYASDSTTLNCIPPFQPAQESVPLRRQVTRYAGEIEVDQSGDGLSFRSVREYQPGDSLNRVDWNRRARTGELTTLEFMQERAATVVVAVDARQTAYVGPSTTDPHAVERTLDAAGRVFARLLDDGHQVGLAALGDEDCWLAPSSGSSHRLRAQRLLSTDPAFYDAGNGGTRTTLWDRRLRRRLPDDAQLLVFSPLVDARTIRILRQFESYGYPVTVISPNPSAAETPAQRLASAHRSVILTEIRQSGIPVLDWEVDQPIEAVLAAGGRVKG